MKIEDPLHEGDLNISLHKFETHPKLALLRQRKYEYETQVGQTSGHL